MCTHAHVHTHAHTHIQETKVGKILLLDGGGQISPLRVTLQNFLLSALNPGTVFSSGSVRENWGFVKWPRQHVPRQPFLRGWGFRWQSEEAVRMMSNFQIFLGQSSFSK